MSTALFKLLHHAASNVSRYKGLPPVLESFPVVDKKSIKADLNAHLDDRFVDRRIQLIGHLQEGTMQPDPLIAFSNMVHIEQTSGSSGIPFRFPVVPAERAALALGIWRRRRSIDPKISIKSVFAIAHRRLRDDKLDLSTDWSRTRIWDSIRKSGATWIHCTPTLLKRLLFGSDPTAIRACGIKFIESTGEAMNECLQQTILEYTEASIQNQYGCREVLEIAAAKNGQSLKVLEENITVEIVDDAGSPIKECGICGRVVVTSLHQYLFPFIRYATGDRAKWIHYSEGAKAIELDSLRPHEVIGGTDGIAGRPVFKNIMVMIMKRLKYPTIGVIRFEQHSSFQFVIYIDNMTFAEEIRDMAYILFNRQAILQHECHFDVRIAQPDAEAHKDALFKNIMAGA